MQHISSSYLRIKGILSKHSHSDKQEWFLFQSHLWKTHLGSSRMRSYSLNFQNKELKNRKLAAYLAFLYCESACNAGDPGSIPGLGRSAGEGIATHSCILGFPCGSTGNRIRQQCERPGFNPWFGKILSRRARLPIAVLLGFPCGSAGKESACNVGDLGSIPGLGGSPGKGKGYPLQCSGLENSMNCVVHGVTKSWTWLSNFRFHTF